MKGEGDVDEIDRERGAWSALLVVGCVAELRRHPRLFILNLLI
jgi:hypothetical protein